VQHSQRFQPSFVNPFTAVAFLLIISIPLFLHIDRLPIRLWDESRLAYNAYEMHKNGNLLVTHFEGTPDMWNTKPPMMIWCQVFFIKIIGFGELALRLPSAIAGFLTCLALLFFSKRFLGNYLPGAFASLVLVTTNGYIDTHAARTGDYDTLLGLFTTIFNFAAFLHFHEKNRRWLICFFVALTFAVLTKSVQALLFLPGIACYYFFRARKIQVFNKTFFISAFASAAVIASYYLGRELQNKGYLLAIWENELGGRYFGGLEENTAGPAYYLNFLWDYLLPYWKWFLPLGVLTGLLSRNNLVRNLSLFTFILASSYFLFISISKTKLYWYTVPLFPLLSLHVGIFGWQAYQLLSKHSWFRSRRIIALALVCIIFIYPYVTIGKKIYNPSEYSWDRMYPISPLLQDAFHGRLSLHNYVICYSDYDTHLRIYATALKEKGQKIEFKKPGELSRNDKVIACEREVFEEIESRYKTELLKEENEVRIYLIR
jgi:4-amino-4-deoxy-L-arabinose transferase-like glycosyltransferase